MSYDNSLFSYKITFRIVYSIEISNKTVEFNIFPLIKGCMIGDFSL